MPIFHYCSPVYTGMIPSYICQLKGLCGQALQEQILAVLTHINLLSKRHSLIGSLSGGMQRRLSIGIALIGSSQVSFRVYLFHLQVYVRLFPSLTYPYANNRAIRYHQYVSLNGSVDEQINRKTF